MKKIALALTLSTLFPVVSPAGPLDPSPTHPVGVADVPWGASPADAKKAMLARTGVSAVSASDGKLVFKDGTFAELPAESWELLFTNGKFSEGFVTFTTSDSLRDYETICKQITGKYHKPGREQRDGTTHRATYWEYTSSTGKWGVVCDMRVPDRLTIRYKDKALQSPAGKPPVKDL